jgi:E3 ubiquitin-protein ligase SIAH1
LAILFDQNTKLAGRNAVAFAICCLPPSKMKAKLTILHGNKAQKEMASNTEHNESTMIDSLREIVECPVCMEVPRIGPFHQCKNGHVVCNRCHPKLNRCPACREPIDGRCLKTEQLLKLVPTLCKFSQSGCKTELVPSLLRNHEIDCETKLMQCPSMTCSTNILPSYLIQHLSMSACKVLSYKCSGDASQVTFGGLLSVDDTMMISEVLRSYVPMSITVFGEKFFRETVRTRDGNWIFWVYFLGSENEAKNYFYTISITNSDKSVKSNYTGQVTSMRLYRAAILKDPNGLILSDKMVKAVMENNTIKVKTTLLMPVNHVKRPLLQLKEEVDENNIGRWLGKRNNPKNTTDAENQKRPKI